uniref:Fibrinogen C-terminal domain-containing protein n=1 Tax=Macrostomum lignano TaxID=282301 RepID=A0A1I8H330_9PLAT
DPVQIEGRTFKIIQHRSKGLLSFGRGWTEYEDGFGDETDFWIGLRKIRQLTGSSPKLLRVEAVTWSDELYVCEYSGFTVADASTNYTMTYTSYLSGSSNTTSDSLADNKGKQFSTIDRDNNQISSSCSAARGNSGWWFKSCTKSNPNGIYHASPVNNNLNYIYWTGATVSSPIGQRSDTAQHHQHRLIYISASSLQRIAASPRPPTAFLPSMRSIPRCKVHWVSRSSSFIVADPSRPSFFRKPRRYMTSNFSPRILNTRAVLRALRFTSKRPVLCVSGDSVLIGSSIFTCGVFSQEEVAHTTPAPIHHEPGRSVADCALKCEQPIVKFCSAFAFVPEKKLCLLSEITTADFAPVAPGQIVQINGREFQVIQHRSKGELSFARSWTEYENGFGDDTDFWIGLRKIHELTGSSPKLLRVEAVTWSDELYVCEYSGFTVADASTNYTMTGISYLSGSSNTTADSFTFNSGMQFSTMDRDNDQFGNHCSSSFGNSGWWFKSCSHTNPNGIYYSTAMTKTNTMHWASATSGNDVALKSIRLMIH